MKKLINKAKYVLTGEDGAPNLEFIIFTAVVLIITIAVFQYLLSLR